MNKALSDTQEEKLVMLKKSYGLTNKNLAIRFSITPPTVREILKKYKDTP